jgi:hypothetical protein
MLTDANELSNIKNIGFIPISRKIFDHRLWKEHRKFSRFEAWLDVLATGRYDSTEGLYYPDKVNVIKYYRGELVASTRYLASRWSWGVASVVRFLAFLEKENMITRRIEADITIIKIVNYEHFNRISSNATGYSYSELSKNDDQKTEQEMEHLNQTKSDQTERKRNTRRNSSGTTAERLRNNIKESINKDNKVNKLNIDTEEDIAFRTFQEWIIENAPKVSKMKEQFNIKQFLLLRNDFEEEQIQTKLLAMDNHKRLLTSYDSAYKTILNWLKRDHHQKSFHYGHNSPKPNGSTKNSSGINHLQQLKREQEDAAS